MTYQDFIYDLQNAPFEPVLRLAPTPSGFLHVGNGVNFLLNFWASQQRSDSHLFLRIDDVDTKRVRPEYVNDIFESMEWLNIKYEKILSEQNKKSTEYNYTLKKIAEKGLLYGSNISRKELLTIPMSEQVAFLENHALPLDTPNTAWRMRGNGVVLRKKDGFAAYHICSVTDDHMEGVTHIIRGEDLQESSLLQAQLQGILGYKVPTLWHHALILDTQGKKISKSLENAPITLRQMRKEKHSPQLLIDYAMALTIH